MRILSVAAICALAVAVLAGSAMAQVLTPLYAHDGYQYFGAGSIGGTRGQHFSPSEAIGTVNDPFIGAGFNLQLDEGEVLTFDLTLYPWVNDYATSVTQTPIAQITNITYYGAIEDWVMLSFPQQAATGQYLMDLKVINFYGGDNWGMLRQSTGNGGPNNDAYNNGVWADREYQVGLVVVPEPATMIVLGLGVCAALRRRRS